MEQLAVITGTFNPLTKAHISMGLLAEKNWEGTAVSYTSPPGTIFSPAGKKCRTRIFYPKKQTFPFGNCPAALRLHFGNL